MLLAAAALILTGCAGQTAGKDAVKPEHNLVEISLTFNRRSGIAANQFAVWIEDASGKYIKTLYVTKFVATGGWKSRPEAVPGWVAKSGIGAGTVTVADVSSGATPKSGPLTYVWDCTDAGGKAVPSGDYRFVAEGTIFWKDAVSYNGVISVGDKENSSTAEATYTTEAAKTSDMITDVSAVYKP
jgi:hypothetical protein